MRCVLKIFQLFLLTLGCVCCHNRTDDKPVAIVQENNGKVNIASLEIIDATTHPIQEDSLFTPDVDESSNVTNSGILTSARQLTDADVSAWDGKEILYSRVVNEAPTDNVTEMENLLDLSNVRTEITVEEDVNGHITRRKLTDEELRSLSHVVAEDQVEDMADIFNMDPDIHQNIEDEVDDESIEDMTSIFRENTETTTQGYKRKIIRTYKEYKIFSSESDGDPFDEFPISDSTVTSEPSYGEITTNSIETTSSATVASTETNEGDLLTSAELSDEQPTTTMAVTTSNEFITTVDVSISPQTTITLLKETDTTTEMVEPQTTRVTSSIISTQTEDSLTTTPNPLTTTAVPPTTTTEIVEPQTAKVTNSIISTQTEDSLTTTSNPLTTTTVLPTTTTEMVEPQTAKVTSPIISTQTEDSFTTTPSPVTTTTVLPTTTQTTGENSTSPLVPNLTSGEVESIYNKQLEEYDSDEDLDDAQTPTTPKKPYNEDLVPAVLTHKILNNLAVFSIKISKKNKTFYVPSNAHVIQNDSAIVITWRDDWGFNQTLVLRLIEHDKFHMIKEIELAVPRDGKVLKQRKHTAFSPIQPEDDSVQGKTRIVMMKDGTYIQFSNVDFLKKSEESEFKAAARSQRLWHVEVASICLTVAVLVSVTAYVATIKAKQRYHRRQKGDEVLDTRC